MSEHLMIAPVLIPLLTGALFLVMYDSAILKQRAMGILACALLLWVAGALFLQALDGTYTIYALGNWRPPFGIVLVLDRLSALMLLLTAGLALVCLLFASRGADTLGAHFHALFQFQIAGINCAFLTGDLFNLFVCFEILLIASYALLLHGGGRARSRAGLHYVILNLIGSALFLLGLGVLYGIVGTLNMADLAVKIAALPPTERPLVDAAAMLLLVVFGIKAAMLPLLFWLPRAYSAASAPVAAMFTIMTKVGIYAIMRVFILVFGLGDVDMASPVWQWIWMLALATLVLGAVGALGAHSLRGLTAYMVIVSVGTLLASISLGSHAGISAALFYLLHTTCLTAAFFLLAGVLTDVRGDAADFMMPADPYEQRWFLGGVFFLGAIAFAGLPPLSGFISKVWILQAAQEGSARIWLWSVLLGAGFMILIALSRAGSALFWSQSKTAVASVRADNVCVSMVLLLLLASAMLSVFAAPVMSVAEAVAAQLLDPHQYVSAVMRVAGEGAGL